jgi:hypothetical protein
MDYYMFTERVVEVSIFSATAEEVLKADWRAWVRH